MRFAVSIALLLVALPAAAIVPYRVADINPIPLSLGSNPAGFATLGGRAIFSTEFSGEVWASDGSAGGTVRIGNGYRVSVVANTGAVIYYTAADFPDDDEAPFRLWVTDGTAAGTFPVLDGRSPSSFNFIFFPVPGSRRIFFSFDDGVHGLELWTSDGSAAGTHLVRDLAPGAAPGFLGYVEAIASFRGKFYFSGLDDGHGSALWATDGTTAGTRLVKDICPGTCSPHAYGFNLLGGRILFAANDAIHGEQLWSTDGTPAGTARVSNLAAPMPFGNYFPGAVAGGNLLFPGLDAVHGRELWATRGRLGTTRFVADLEPGEE